MEVLAKSRVWGLNLGEFDFGHNAHRRVSWKQPWQQPWQYFEKGLAKTNVCFVWINELNTNAGVPSSVHQQWLNRKHGLFCGKQSVLASNRQRAIIEGTDIWSDPTNAALKHPLACKFLFNPTSTRQYQQRASDAGRNEGLL